MTVRGCSLGAAELDAQLARFRDLGQYAASIEHGDLDVVVRFAADPPAAVLEAALAVERACCPFFLIDYDAPDRRLAVSVSCADERPALDALALALAA